MTPPNIVFICADQLSAKWLGCYGSGVDSTPTLDRLAESGTLFTRYYATHPLCAPNRATMLTGRSAHVHGIVSNNYALATDTPTYATVLRTNGYATGGFGKFHQTPMMWPVPTSLDFLGFDTAVVNEDPKWGPYMDWVRQHHPDQYDAALAMANGHSGFQGPAAETESAQGASSEQIHARASAYPELLQGRIEASAWERMYASPIDSKAHDSTFITDAALSFLAEQDGSRPFLCHVSYVDPHDPYDPPEPYASLFDPGRMPNALPAEWEAQGPECLSAVQANYLRFGRIAANPAAVCKLRALYHGQLKLLDDQIARILRSLRELGLWENTIIVFTSDHGEHLGDHGMISKGLAHYDAGIRCPLIVGGGAWRGADRTSSAPESASHCSDRLSCTLDLFPAFCDWAGVPTEARPPLEGRSFVGADHRGWESVTATLQDVASIVTCDGFRLTWYPGTREGQLFDLNADPDEGRNLFEEPSAGETRRRLFEELTSRLVVSAGLPHYRNFPADGDWKWDPNARPKSGGGPSRLRRYANPGSPWLDPELDRPEWHGEP